MVAFHRAMAGAAAEGAAQRSPVGALVSTSGDKTTDSKLRERARVREDHKKLTCPGESDIEAALVMKKPPAAGTTADRR